MSPFIDKEWGAKPLGLPSYRGQTADGSKIGPKSSRSLSHCDNPATLLTQSFLADAVNPQKQRPRRTPTRPPRRSLTPPRRRALHLVGRTHAEQPERKRDHALGGHRQRHPERLNRRRRGTDHPAVAIERGEVLRELERVRGDPVRR